MERKEEFFYAPSIHIHEHSYTRMHLCSFSLRKNVTKVEFLQSVHRTYRSVNNPQQKIKPEEQKNKVRRNEMLSNEICIVLLTMNLRIYVCVLYCIA